MEKEFSENINSESPQPFSDVEDRITENINSEVSQPGLEVAGGITENINSSPGDGTRESATDTLAELCAATIKRRGKRGRPKGVGRKHPDQCQPKTFRHFSPLAHGLLGLIRLGDPELMAQSEAEIVEEALVRLARCLSNQNPLLAKQTRKSRPIMIENVAAFRALQSPAPGPEDDGEGRFRNSVLPSANQTKSN